MTVEKVKEKKAPVLKAQPTIKDTSVKDTSVKVDGYKFAKERDAKRKKVKGIFHFHEVPNGYMEFVFREFKGDPIKKYKFFDGQVYEIPLGVAQHLNKNGWYPVHKHAFDENDRPSVKIGKKIRRFSFQSLDFVDTKEFDVPADLITVEKIV